MSKERRWLKSVLETSAKTETTLPWQRGTVRAANIARRSLAVRKRSAQRG